MWWSWKLARKTRNCYHRAMDPQKLEQVKAIITSHPEIKLAYLFGSQATGIIGPMSDYDFAFYIDGLDSAQRFDLRLKLDHELSKILHVDAVDIVVLNDTDAPELTYDIIREGIVLHEEEPYKVIVEPRILNEYFDFHEMLKRHGLTRVP